MTDDSFLTIDDCFAIVIDAARTVPVGDTQLGYAIDVVAEAWSIQMRQRRSAGA